MYEWIATNPREMDKIVIKAAKTINKENAKAVPRKTMSEGDESKLVNAISNPDNQNE